MFRMTEATSLETFNTFGDGIVDQIKALAKSDQGSGIIDALKSVLGKKEKAPAPMPMAPNPYLAPTTTGFNWMYVAVPAGVLALGLGAWLLLRKK